jgi:hypothetical protein
MVYDSQPGVIRPRTRLPPAPVFCLVLANLLLAISPDIDFDFRFARHAAYPFDVRVSAVLNNTHVVAPFRGAADFRSPVGELIRAVYPPSQWGVL